MNACRHNASRGFTLLEMAVVMVIVGLIIGGIFAAQSMIRSSHLQNMLGEYDAHVKAIKEFQDKYLSLPGDMSGNIGARPEDMWGADTSCPATASTATPHIATCNGDGNGSIGTSDFSGNLSDSREWFRAWQHLSNAGFMPTPFSGTPGSGGATEARIGINVPASNVSGAGWTVYFYSLTTTNAFLWGDQYGHVLSLGGFAASDRTLAPVLSPSEALAVDQKIDDGYPGMGIVRAYRTAYLPACTTNDTSQSAQAYNNNGSNSRACSLMFLTRF